MACLCGCNTRCAIAKPNAGKYMDLLSLGINSIFRDNILLAYFLGMCSFLAISRQMKTAVGLGIAIILVMAVTAPINWALYHYLLTPGALSFVGLPDMDLRYLKLILFISSVAATVQILEIVIDRFLPALYMNLGIFLPLITVNCAIFGVLLFMVERDYNFTQTVVFSISSGMGWCLAIIVMAAVQKKLRYANAPAGLKGFGLSMISTGLIAIGFMLFAGM